MPTIEINGVNINYEVLGERGPFIALSPGGRREMGNVRTLANRLARAGYRVLIHDRRNCGVSDVAFDGSRSEYEIWADDLHALLTQLNGLPAVLSGGSSGGRLALLFALKYPDAVRALLLYRITGGPFAAKRLAYQYYDQYIELVRNGGMQAVAESEHFAERIKANPKNRERLLAMDSKQFVDVMTRWRSHFVASADLPVIGVTEQQLNSIKVPTCIIPGNDKTHSHITGNAAHRMILGSELHDLWPGDLDIDLFPPEDWATREAEQAAIFAEFLAHNGIT
jgi:pimeloyl-ACP methyl ester carboxylesterase